MSLPIVLAAVLNQGFPRSRGDEPAEMDKLREAAMFSPLTRG